MLVGTVTDDVRVHEVPKMKVCALRFTENARARILKVGLCMPAPMLLIWCQVHSLIGKATTAQLLALLRRLAALVDEQQTAAQLLLAQASGSSWRLAVLIC